MDISFSYLDLRCFTDPSDARHYYYLSTTADVRRGSDQRPMITMLDLGSSAFVMFTATWGASSARVEALRREIAQGHQDHDPSRIKLSFAPVSSPQCHVLLGDGTGSFQIIATSATSRVPPYDALFNLSIPPERLASARSAVRGERGFLAIEYLADLHVPSTGTATFRANAGELLPWLRRQRNSGKSIRALLEEAVELNLANVAVNVPDRLGGDVAVELFERVLSQVAQVAPRWIAEGGSGSIEVEATIECGSPEPIRVFADIGRIVASASARPS